MISIDADASACSHYALGGTLWWEGHIDGAICAYQKAVELDVGHAGAHFSLGNILENRGEADSAIASYVAAAKADPQHTGVHYSMGNVLQNKGDLLGAEAAYRRVLEIDPRHRSALYNLGSVLWSRGDLDQAAVMYQRMLDLNGQDVKALKSLARLLQNLGDLEGAVLVYRQILEVDPAHTGAQCAQAAWRYRGFRGSLPNSRGSRPVAWLCPVQLGSCPVEQGRSSGRCCHIPKGLSVASEIRRSPVQSGKCLENSQQFYTKNSYYSSTATTKNNSPVQPGDLKAAEAAYRQALEENLFHTGAQRLERGRGALPSCS
ncbi:unnamed protein product [Polarella glacialis]|uniref:UDP-N-acetylglucosamine--peptide N-acetylglucosaminyltransferase SPINDLY n=1 Tax=Polarella glacialis TaxID=89957 RepID=A0A813FH02_POLGL|nr:unnamed protein product [Polarella glacialis]